MDQFEACLNKVRRVIERYVQYRLNGSGDAEDVLQEVYAMACLKFDQLKDPNAFKPWILSIAKNQCADYFRRQGRCQEVPMEEVPEAKLCYGRQGILVTSPVEDTLELLAEKDSQILRLFFWQELSQTEIARILDIPVGTVKSRIHTAKRHFKERYPYPPKQTKGDTVMNKLPGDMPEYTIEKLDKEPFATRCEELQGWLIVPKEGQKVTWGMYDFPERKRTEYTQVEAVGRAEVHGIQGVEIVAVQYGENIHSTGLINKEERRFVAQLTDTHSRYLAECHMENGVRKCVTFLDGDEFLNNWGFGQDNCGAEVELVPKGLLRREGSSVTAPAMKEVMDVVGRYAVTICGKTYDTVCVMDVELYNEAVATEQYIDQNGRTVLWRRYNRDNWAMDRFGGKLWSEKLPKNERITINGETYVHWYDCLTDYVV